MPTAPPNSGPKFRDIMKYDPPPGTTPLVEMAEREMAVNMVVQQLNEKNGGEQKKKKHPSLQPEESVSHL